MTFGSNVKINESGEGRIVACGFGTSSDFRLKQNIKSYKAEKSILDLDVKEFEYINDTDTENDVIYGHIDGFGHLFHKSELKKLWWKGNKYYEDN